MTKQPMIGHNSVTLGVEAWAAIGLIGSIVALIIGLIWIVFCVMLYRHNKERRGSDEDSNEVKIKIRREKLS